MAAVVHRIPLDDLLALLNRPVLFQVRWKVAEDEGNRFLVDCIRDARHRIGIAGRAGIATPLWSFASGRLTVRSVGQERALSFPEEANPVGMALGRGAVPTFFAVTLGDGPVAHGKWLKDSGEFQKYFLWHGFCAELADAAAEWVERQVAAAGSVGGATRRYSPGYPAWPDIEIQEFLLGMLNGDALGITLTSAYQLVPEFSVTGVVIRESPEGRT